MSRFVFARYLSGLVILVAGCATGPECADATRDGAAGSTADEGIQIADLSVGGKHVCAVDDAGRVYCWGRNADGQLGDGTTRDRSRPTRVPTLDDVQHVAAGAAHTCALHDNGQVSCWGFGRDDSRPHLVAGISSDAELEEYADGGRDIDISFVHRCNLEETLDGIVEITAGITETCAVHESGGVLCWDRTTRVSRDGKTVVGCPTPVSGIEEAVDVGIGASSACTLHGDGTTSCWGEGVTLPEDHDVKVPGKTAVPRASSPRVRLREPGGWQELVVGGWETCMRTEEGAVHCLGSNIQGSLKPGDPHPLHGPTQLDWLDGVRAVGAAGQQICAAGMDGAPDDRVRCAGLDDGALVGGNRADAASPRPVPGTEQAVEVAVGGYGLAGSRLDPSNPGVPDVRTGEARRRGVNAFDLEEEDGAVSGYTMGNSGGFGCVRTDADDVACWGNNDHGQLGDGTTDSRATARRVDFSKRGTPTARSDSEAARPGASKDSATKDENHENCAADRAYGRADAPNKAVFRYLDRSRTFHLPALSAEMIRRPDGTELLRIGLPDVTTGELAGTPKKDTYPWKERRLDDYAVFIELPDGNTRGGEGEKVIRDRRLPVTVGAEAGVPKKWDCMRVPLRGRGDATISEWKRPAPGRISGRVAGRLEIGTGPAAFGEIVIEFDIDGVVPPPGERAVGAKEAFFRAKAGDSAPEDRREAPNVAVVADSDQNRLSVQLRGEAQSRRFVFEDFAGRPGVYKGRSAASHDATFLVDLNRFGADGARGRIERLTDTSNALHFFGHLDARTTLPEDRGREVVAAFDVDTVLELPDLDPVYLSSELERPGLVSAKSLRPGSLPDAGSSVAFRTAPLGLADNRKHARFVRQPSDSVPENQVAFTFRSGIVKDGEMRSDREAPAPEFVVSEENGLPVNAMQSFQMRYAWSTDQTDEIDGLKLDSGNTKRGRGRVVYTGVTTMTVEYGEREIAFEAANPFQGKHRWSYPTRRQAVPAAQIPLLVTTLPLEPGYATTVTSVSATAERSGREAPAGGLDTAPSVQTYRIDPRFETVRLGVIDTRDVQVGDREEKAHVVRVAHPTEYGRELALYWVGADSGRLLKYRPRDGDHFFYRFTE